MPTQRRNDSYTFRIDGSSHTVSDLEFRLAMELFLLFHCKGDTRNIGFTPSTFRHWVLVFVQSHLRRRCLQVNQGLSSGKSGFCSSYLFIPKASRNPWTRPYSCDSVAWHQPSLVWAFHKCWARDGLELLRWPPKVPAIALLGSLVF